jgi:RNase adaptor protein for sRNA GlmZ degradation
MRAAREEAKLPTGEDGPAFPLGASPRRLRPEACLVFDLRRLRNPRHEPVWQRRAGPGPVVGGCVAGERTTGLLLPRLVQAGKKYAATVIICPGLGRRSGYLAKNPAARLNARLKARCNAGQPGGGARCIGH